MTTPARLERAALCDLMVAVGPDAPTLCDGWNTRDLAAHLVVRERRPDGALGIIVKPFAAYGERVRQHEARRDYADIVERVRSGPPLLSPTHLAAVDRMVNTIEFFVHHEDVRRGADEWGVRDLDPDLERDLHHSFVRSVKMLTRKAPAPLVLAPVGYEPIAVNEGSASTPPVTVTGPLGEIVLFAYGRQQHAMVDLEGSDDAVAAANEAGFGV